MKGTRSVGGLMFTEINEGVERLCEACESLRVLGVKFIVE